MLSFLVLVPDGDPTTLRRDDPTLISDLGFATDVWARWDSYWFIEIARGGYDGREQAAAFYPLYPALLAGLGRVLLGHYVLAGIILSLLASAAAFVLLHDLTRRLLGVDGAFRTVLFLAIFPTSLFLSAVNIELFALLLLFCALTVVAWRRLGTPYGVFAAASLAIALAAPTQAYPLLSLSRFGLVVFPFFLGLALLARSTRAAALVTGVSALLLGVHLTQWVLWQWVA